MTIAEVTIASIADGGDGVARHEGLVLFIPRTAPGDRVVAEFEAKGRFAHAKLERVIDPSAQRVDAPCKHYLDDRCGGCHLQHLEYGKQLDAKQGIVADALQRIGKRPTPVSPTRASPAQWRYRRKLTLALRRSGPRWIAGLHPFDRPGDVFPIDDCPITEAVVLDVWRDVMRASSHLPDARELRAAVTVVDGKSRLVVEGGTEWPAHERFFAAVASLTSVWWHRESSVPTLLHSRGGDDPGASFTQVNAGVARELKERVIELVMSASPETVIDAYAGTGDIAIELSARGVNVTAIELDVNAVARAESRLGPGSRAIAGRVEHVLPSVLPADAVIVNPPRGGLHADACAAIESANPRPTRLIYVSCNPATLARDVGRLPSYRITSVEPFDMFPQTAHVETVCAFEPAA